MKRKLLIAALLLPGAVFAREIDVSDHPKRKFFVGYSHTYQDGCHAHMWWNLRNEYTLIASDKCQGHSDKRLYDDMLAAMKEVRAKSKASSFGEYYDEEWKAEREKLEQEDAKPFTELDVTNNPNMDKEALVGYSATYSNADNGQVICEITFTTLPGGSSFLRSDQPCIGVTKKKAFTDALYAANDLKATTYAKNFTELSSSTERHYRCMSIGMDGYLYSPHLAPKKPGNWYKVYYFSSARKVSPDPVGVWRFFLDGKTIISNIGHTKTGFDLLNMEEVYDCNAR